MLFEMLDLIVYGIFDYSTAKKKTLEHIWKTANAFYVIELKTPSSETELQGVLFYDENKHIRIRNMWLYSDISGVCTRISPKSLSTVHLFFGFIPSNKRIPPINKNQVTWFMSLFLILIVVI